MPRRHATPIFRRCGGGVVGVYPHHPTTIPCRRGRRRSQGRHAPHEVWSAGILARILRHHITPPQSRAGEGAGAPREGTRHTRSGPRASLPAVSVIKSPHPQSHAGEGDGAPREDTRHTGSGPRASLPAFSVTHLTPPQSHAFEGDGAPMEGTRRTRSGPRASLPAFSVRSPLRTPTVGACF